MSYIIHDPDEYESVSESRPCTGCHEKPVHEPDRTYFVKVCTGRCNGMFSTGLRKRDPADVAAIKERRRKFEEDRTLAEAELIRWRRGS